MKHSGHDPATLPPALRAQVEAQLSRPTTKQLVAAALEKSSSRPRAARTRNGGTWTEAAFWGRIRTELRRIHRFWRPKMAALRAARVPCSVGGVKFAYVCADCGKFFRKEGVEVDHVIPAGALRCAADLAGFVERLFPEDPGAYRVRCKVTCHRAKTNAENAARRDPAP